MRTALKNNGISLPPKKVTVNLAPADLRKEGAGFDLPVAAAVLAAAGFIEPQLLRNVMVVGELSLNGEVRSVSGVLPRVIRARELGCRYCIIPFENLAEGALVKDMKVVGVQNIKEVLKRQGHGMMGMNLCLWMETFRKTVPCIVQNQLLM